MYIHRLLHTQVSFTFADPLYFVPCSLSIFPKFDTVYDFLPILDISSGYVEEKDSTATFSNTRCVTETERQAEGMQPNVALNFAMIID